VGSAPIAYSLREESSPEPTSRVAELVAGPGSFGALRVVGQAHRTFVVCESATALVVVDQHAADERVRFDRLRAQHAARSVSMQRLLLPERVEVAASEAALVAEHEDDLLHLGVEASRIGDTTVAVRAIPALVRRAAPDRLLRDLVAQLALSGERTFGDAIDTALATMACHGAIRAGDALSERECKELLLQLDAVADFARHCPHGRPVAFEMSFTDLGRRVGR
jgi:DNA mismatch repair protein MutL